MSSVVIRYYQNLPSNVADTYNCVVCKSAKERTSYSHQHKGYVCRHCLNNNSPAIVYRKRKGKLVMVTVR